MTKASGNQQLCDENENKKGKAALNGDIGEHDEVAELQWRSMVSALAAEGRLDNCTAVCGLTDPATDPATSAAIALGLLISELSQEPWKGRVITFNETHQLHKLHGANLKVKLQPLVAALGPLKKGTNLQGVVVDWTFGSSPRPRKCSLTRLQDLRRPRPSVTKDIAFVRPKVTNGCSEAQVRRPGPSGTRIAFGAPRRK